MKGAWGLVSVVLASLALSACGDSGDGGGTTVPATPQSALPAPQSGKATVGGKAVKDGAPLANLPLRLDGESLPPGRDLNGRTDANGKFVFEGVAPDVYQLRSILRQTPECSDVPGFQVIPNDTNPDNATAMLLFGEPFTAKAGERVVKDIIASC